MVNKTTDACNYPHHALVLWLVQDINGPALDIWCLGCILFSMLCGKLPFDDGKLSEFRIPDDPTMIEQLQAFGKVFRHPGGRVINIAHYALVRKEDFMASNWDQHDMQWVPFRQVPDLAFDRNEIVEYAKERLKRRVKRRPVGFRLLPDEFTLGQLQNLYETALGKTFDKRNFRKKLFKTTLLIDLEKKADGKAPGQHKGSQLFSFNKDKYQKMKIQGYDFLF